MAENIANVLGSVPLFSACSKKDRKELAKATSESNVPAGQAIVREGQGGGMLFVILDGEARVRVGDRVKARLGPGSHFGEIAVLDGGARTATVTAVTDVRLVSITDAVFKRVLREQPEMGFKLAVSLASMVRAAQKPID